MSGTAIALWEGLGTAVLLLIGVGANANLTLDGMPGRGQGALMGALTWGFGVFAGSSIAAPSGGHLNPAVTLASAILGRTPWSLVPWYWSGQLVGAGLGAFLAWLVYKTAFDRHHDHSGSVRLFSTMPVHHAPVGNAVTEIVATGVLVLFVLLSPVAAGDGLTFGNSALGYAGGAFAVIAVGAGLGGPTSWALNPARDLGPRLVYSVLPIRGKGPAGWSYQPVPLLAPMVGAALVALLVRVLPTP